MKILPSSRNLPIRHLAAAMLFAFGSAAGTQAADRTWLGNSSVNLLDAANWSAPPVTGSDSLVFGAAGTAGTNITVNGTYNAVFTGGGSPAIDFTASAPAYTFGGSSQLTVSTGGLRNQSGQTQTFNNPFRVNTSNILSLVNANSALVFGGDVVLQAGTTNLSMGGASGHSMTFSNLVLGSTPTTNLTIAGGASTSTLNLNGSTNAGLTGSLTIGQNVTVNIGSSTGLSTQGSSALVTMNAAGASIANTSGAALTTSASLSFNGTAQNYAFGASGHTAVNSMTFAGTTAINADQNRTLTINGSGVSVTSASVWNNTVTSNRTLTVNGAGNTFGIGGLAIGAAGETADVRLTLAGSANITVAGGITVGAGTGTRSLQHNGSATVAINGSSNYTGTTGVGETGTLLVNGTHTGGANYSVAGILGGTGTINLSSGNATINFVSGGTGRLQAASADSLTIIGGTAAALNLTNSINTPTGRLLFTLNAPGTTVVDVQGLLAIGTGLLDWNDFAFTAGAGFGAGSYRLFDYNTLSGTLGATLTGTINGFDATISNDTVNGAILLTVVPEPSTYALVGVSLAGLALLFRRRRTI